MADPAGEPGTGTAVLGAGDFDACLAPLGPFEPNPHLAIAVSGGADSMALCLLGDAWARRRGGTVTGLTVDHGLRAESAAEARQVGGWLAARGIAHRILVWRSAKPTRNRQAAARQARYCLLGEWCRGHDVLHLLLGHHLEDQAETLLLRLARGSGVAGLAAMAPVSETADARLLRPLLAVAKARLTATLAALGQAWLEDPSNADPSHARVRMRRALPTLAREGADPARLARTATHAGRSRAAIEDMTAACLAEAVAALPAGYAYVDPRALGRAPREIGLRALAAVLSTVGGRAYAPRFGRLEPLYDALIAGEAGRGRTLAGCRIVAPAKSARPVPPDGALLVCREAAAARDETMAAPGKAVHWDGRFRVLASVGGAAAVSVGRLGRGGWREVRERAPAPGATGIPAPVRPSLPALRDDAGLLAVPHLGYFRPPASAETVTADFRPPAPLAGAGFFVLTAAGSSLAATQISVV